MAAPKTRMTHAMPMKHGTTRIAFFRDPGRHPVELAQPEWLPAPGRS